MKSLDMQIARDLKRNSYFRPCYKCGHMNNGETISIKKICICAVPNFKAKDDKTN